MLLGRHLQRVPELVPLQGDGLPHFVDVVLQPGAGLLDRARLEVEVLVKDKLRRWDVPLGVGIQEIEKVKNVGDAQRLVPIHPDLPVQRVKNLPLDGRYPVLRDTAQLLANILKQHRPRAEVVDVRDCRVGQQKLGVVRLEVVPPQLGLDLHLAHEHVEQEIRRPQLVHDQRARQRRLPQQLQDPQDPKLERHQVPAHAVLLVRRRQHDDDVDEAVEERLLLVKHPPGLDAEPVKLAVEAE